VFLETAIEDMFLPKRVELETSKAEEVDGCCWS